MVWVHSKESERFHSPCLGVIVFAPPLVSNSAGIFCLYQLCQELQLRGCIALIASDPPVSTLPGVRVISKRSAGRLCREGFVAVYSETVSGNPLRAATVVRWVLNRPGLLGGDEIYDPSELVFIYSDVYRPYVKNQIQGKLYMPTINEEQFWAPPVGQNRRDLECFYIGKSTWKGGFVDRNSTLEITRWWPRRAGVAAILRKSRALYCFDNSTMLIYEALLCGCPVAVIPDGTQAWQDYCKLELGVSGISWGTSEFDSGEFDPTPLRDRLEGARNEFSAQLDFLLRLVSGRSGEIPKRRLLALVSKAEFITPKLHLFGRQCGLRRRLRSVERTIRLGRRRLISAIFSGSAVSKSKRVEPDFDFDAEVVEIPQTPGACRQFNCHVPDPSETLDLREISPDSIALDPESAFDPRNVALLLRRTQKLTCWRLWPSMARLAERCGCRVVLPRR